MSEVFKIERDVIYVNRLGVTIGPMIERRPGFEGDDDHPHVFAFAGTTYTKGGFVLDEQHPVNEDLIREATSTEILANGFLGKLTEFISLPDEVMTEEMNQWLQHAHEVIIGLSQDATVQMNEVPPSVPMPSGNGTPEYDAMPPLILNPDVSTEAPRPSLREWRVLTPGGCWETVNADVVTSRNTSVDMYRGGELVAFFVDPQAVIAGKLVETELKPVALTERLWIQFVGSEHKGFDLVKQFWLLDSQDIKRLDFVRTDRTREREIKTQS